MRDLSFTAFNVTYERFRYVLTTNHQLHSGTGWTEGWEISKPKLKKYCGKFKSVNVLLKSFITHMSPVSSECNMGLRKQFYVPFHLSPKTNLTHCLYNLNSSLCNILYENECHIILYGFYNYNSINIQQNTRNLGCCVPFLLAQVVCWKLRGPLSPQQIHTANGSQIHTGNVSQMHTMSGTHKIKFLNTDPLWIIKKVSQRMKKPI